MVAGALAHHRHLNVLTRHGAPHFLRDLEGVSAGQAKTIIILQPDTAKVGPRAAVTAAQSPVSHLLLIHAVVCGPFPGTSPMSLPMIRACSTCAQAPKCQTALS